ncbi:MAG: hypothetical protein ACFFD2_17540 [Promethearchaeota archaeon]
MEFIELKPIGSRIVILYLIKHKKFEWSKNEEMNINFLLKIINFKFISFDLNYEECNKNSYHSLLRILRNSMKPYFILDIPEDVKKDLIYDILRDKEQIEEIELEYKLINNKMGNRSLKKWIEYIKAEAHEKEYFLNLKVKPRWIAKGMLDLIDLYNEGIIHILHFTSGDIFTELSTILKELEITVVNYDIKEKFLTTKQINP